MGSTSKAVVLAAGLGSRMQRSHGDAAGLSAEQARAAESGWKAMMPIQGRPFLDYSLHALADAGIDEVCLVVSPEHGAMRRHYDQVDPKRLDLHYAVQEEPKGTAHALSCAEEFAEGEPVLLLNGDNYYPSPVLARMTAQDGPALAAFGAQSVLCESLPEEEQESRLLAYAGVELDEEGFLLGIVEKPADVPTWVSMNCWRLAPTIFRSCAAISPSARGELELPSAVMHSVAQFGQRYKSVPARGPVLDLSHQADIARVQASLAELEIQL